MGNKKLEKIVEGLATATLLVAPGLNAGQIIDDKYVPEVQEKVMSIQIDETGNLRVSYENEKMNINNADFGNKKVSDENNITSNIYYTINGQDQFIPKGIEYISSNSYEGIDFNDINKHHEYIKKYSKSHSLKELYVDIQDENSPIKQSLDYKNNYQIIENLLYTMIAIEAKKVSSKISNNLKNITNYNN